MRGLFNPDNRFWRFMGKLWDALWVSILWILCSIPIVTIGASTTAVYYVTMKLVKDEESYVTKQFFKAFKENFKQATIVWLLLLLSGCGLFSSFIYFFYAEDTVVVTFMMAIDVIMAVVWMFISQFIYAVIARFSNNVKNIFVMAMTLSSKNWYFTIINILIQAVILVAAYFFPPLFLAAMGWTAFFQSFFIRKIFDKYIWNVLHFDPKTGVALVQDEKGNYVLPKEEISDGPVDMSIFEVRTGKEE